LAHPALGQALMRSPTAGYASAPAAEPVSGSRRGTGLVGEAIGPFALDPVLSASPLAQPIVGVGVDHLIGLGDQPEVEVVCPSGEFEVELLHQFLG
jgi:hypothetical protein